MSKEIISNKQAVSIISLYIMGSTLVLGVGAKSSQNVWLSIIIASMMAFPMIYIYSKTLSLFAGNDIYAIAEIVFGKVLGKLIGLAFTWYAFHLGSLVIRNFGEFITSVSLPETPKLLLMIMLAALSIWMVKEGIEVLGRMAYVIFPIIAFIIISVVLLSLTEAELTNLLPILENGLTPVFSDAFSIFAFPFTETVLIMAAFHASQPNKGRLKVYLLGLLFGSCFLLIISLRNIVVLGADTISLFYFPSYEAVTKIDIANFLQRIEVLVSVVFIFAGLTKICVCLLAACKGLSSVLQLDNYRFIVAPIGFLMVNFAYWIYDDIMEMKDFAFNYYKFYAFPFEVILPVTIFLVAILRLKAGKLKINCV